MHAPAFRIVLIEPSHPGNVGAAARAMKNMDLEELHLVAPRDYPSPEAVARASGADDVLARAQVWDSLDPALAGCVLVAGASARVRNLACPQLDAREGAARLVQASDAGPVALLFGRERSGLTNAELDRCHLLIQIPSNPGYSSLNLAAAVQVLAYELFVAAACRDGAPAPAPGEPPASAEDMARFYEHLEQVLVDIDFLDPDNPGRLMRRLMRLFNRARPEATELRILRGILTAMEQARRGR